VQALKGGLNRLRRSSQQAIIQSSGPLKLGFARKFLFNDQSSAMTHCASALWFTKQSNNARSHIFIVAGRHDKTGFTLNDGFTRAADVSYDYRARGGHIFKNGIREAFSLRA
jgi:hypothetical protein